MSRASYVFLFLLFFFCVGCTRNDVDQLITKTPIGYSAPVKLSSIAPIQDDRTWEEKAEAIMKIADQEAQEEATKAAPQVSTPKVKPAKKIAKVAKNHRHSKARVAHHKKLRAKGRVALK